MRTTASRSILRGRLVCEFDEYVSDTPHNRALKSVIILLIRHGEVQKSRRDSLRRLLPYLESVTRVAPSSIRWNTLTYHRSNANYRLLLGVCELVVKGLLPTQSKGETRLSSWISDDQMSALYERFLLEYFRFHYPKLSPAAQKIPWDVDSERSRGLEQLPEMRTDVTLRSKHSTLIIDAKYYSQEMQDIGYNKPTVRSGHLYQVFSYVTNAASQSNHPVNGLLLYARVTGTQKPDLDMAIQGSRIGARTLNLNVPWESLRKQLVDIATSVTTSTSAQHLTVMPGY